MSTTEKIIDYFTNNEDVFVQCMEELDNYNGYLGEDRYYCMGELPDYLAGECVDDILRMAYYGRDEESWHKDSDGNKIYDSFCPNRNYFRFNGCGNLVSADWIDYSDHLDHYAVEAMAENRRYIDSIDYTPELSELFDELEEEE